MYPNNLNYFQINVLGNLLTAMKTDLELKDTSV